MVRLTDRPDMTLNVYRGRETTTQQPLSRTYFHGFKGVQAIDVLLYFASEWRIPGTSVGYALASQSSSLRFNYH